MKLSSEIIHLLKSEGFVIVSTIDAKETIHCSAKGIVGIEEEGKIYIIDLYRSNTFNNLKRNPTISITAVDEAQFSGYTLKGKAKIIEREKIEDHIIKSWEERIIQRVSKRVISDIQKERKTPYHPEVLFPAPEYLIEIEVEDIIDLTPTHLKRQ